MEKENARAPLEKIENLNENRDESDNSPFTLITDKPSSRRVSFASSNFIKKFSIDPEKNTIWDATYEEMLTSDSTHSLENAQGTLLGQQTSSEVQTDKKKVGRVSIIFNNEGGEDMDLTANSLIDKENVNDLNISPNVKVCSTYKENHQQMRGISCTTRQNCIMADTTLGNMTMELTECIPPVSNFNNATHMDITSSMDCTQFTISQKIIITSDQNNRTVIGNETVEYTCQIPNITIENATAEVNETIIEPNSMELTMGIGRDDFNLETNRASLLNMEESIPVANNFKSDSGRNFELSSLSEEQQKSRISNVRINTVELNAQVGTQFSLIESMNKTTNDGMILESALNQTHKKLDVTEKNGATSSVSPKRNNAIQPYAETKVRIDNIITNDPQKNCTNNEIKNVTVTNSLTSILKDKSSHFPHLDENTNMQRKKQLNTSLFHVPHRDENSFNRQSNISLFTTLNQGEHPSSENSVPRNEKCENLDKTITKHPKGSFSVNGMLSPYSDDTQHLINYNLSNQNSKSDFSKIIAGDLNPSFINSKVMVLSDFSCDTLPMSLESTREGKSPAVQTTYIVNSELLEKSVRNKRLSSDIPDCHSEPVVKCKRLLLDDQLIINTNENNDVDSNKSVNISQEDITLLESSEPSFSQISEAAQAVIHDITNFEISSEPSKNNTRIESKKFIPLWDKYLSDSINIKSSLIDSENKMKHLEGRLRNNVSALKSQLHEEIDTVTAFSKKCKIDVLTPPENVCLNFNYIEPVEIKQQEEFLGVQLSNDFSLQTLPHMLSLEEEIRKKCKRSKQYWTIISITEGICKIHTLFRTLRLEIKFDKIDGTVSKTDVFNTISADSEPSALLVHKILKERLSEKNIQSGVGEKYEILTLLDYLYINMQKIIDILDLFDIFIIRYNFELDRNFMGTFQIIDIQLRNSWTFTVDMSELENISEKSIHVTTDAGAAYEKEIKKLTNTSSCGLPFLKKFLKDAKDYIDLCRAQKYI